MRLQFQPGNLITLFVGICFIAAGLYVYRFMGRFLDTAHEASGVVVEVSYESTNKKGRVHPAVRFTTSEGREVVSRSDEHHNVRPGDTVRLIYDPRRPENIEITTLERARKRRWLFSGSSVALGIFVCLLGVGVIRSPVS